MPQSTTPEITNLAMFKKFYGVVQKIFGVTIALMHPEAKEGIALGPPEGWNPFCSMVESDSKLRIRCHQCDIEHREESKRLRRSISYTCHAGFTDFVIPIIVDKEIVAYFQCGQVLEKPPTEHEWDKIQAMFENSSVDLKTLRRHYFGTRVIDPETQKNLVDLLEIFANYVADTGKRLLFLEKNRKSQIVFLAESFIRNNIDKKVALDEVARAAFTSKRNLTRVFCTETKLTVLDYINKLRIDKAGELLMDPKRKISSIAFDSGFGSVQQFNRVFRRYKKCTPRKWRVRQVGK
jgi:AraC-like DNA-binding protein/ligand-binding sensor protein